MAVVDLLDGRIVADVPQREVLLIKQVPGAKYDNRSQRWRIPLSWAACKQLRGVFGERLHIGPSLEAWAWIAYERVTEVIRARDRALDPELDAGGDPRLYKFQRTGSRWLRLAGSGILADDMGTGKTVQSLVSVEVWPLLVVTTKSVRQQWADAVAEWTTGAAVVLDGSIAARRKQLDTFRAAVESGSHPNLAMVVNYDQLVSHSRLAPYGSIALTDKERTPKELNGIDWGTVIADECHKIKEPKTKWTRALWAISNKAQRRVGLTGTPTESSLLDFWALLHFAAPDEWPSKIGFVDRYCVTAFNPFGGLDVARLRADTEDEFRELTATRFLRRPKDLVAPWLPKKVSVVRHAAMSTKQAAAYKALEKEFCAELDNGGELVAFTDLTVSARLAQLTAAMLEEYGSGRVDEDGRAIPAYRMVEPSPKLDELEEVLAELGDAPVAVFSASRQLLRLAEVRLDKAGITYGIIAGGLPKAALDMARDEFNAGRTRVLLISMGSGAEGLNLSRGSHEIFLDRHWSFLKNSQAEDRMHGIGRGDKDAEAITIIDIIAPKTVDEGRYKLYSTKGDLMEHLVRDKEVIRRMLKGEV